MQLSLFEPEVIVEASSNYQYVRDLPLDKVFEIFDKINQDESHKLSSDDICTPMACVKKMIDYLPDELWARDNLKILDPCSGNGNFPAYCTSKTDIDNIWLNDINPLRNANAEALLHPTHLSDINALEIDSYGQWDLIMANPPYSGGGNKNRSLSNLFIEHSIALLKPGGYLCFVTPNNWMTYNNDNVTLKKLLGMGSFLVIDNNVKRYFPKVGSSFTIFVWQKGVFDNKTYVVNKYLVQDVQHSVTIPRDLPFIPLYLSNSVIGIIQKTMSQKANFFNYRCDLHNHTKANLLADERDSRHPYKTIHTTRKTRYAQIKQDIYDKYLVLIPLSTYYKPFIEHHVNVTQSIGYIPFDDEHDAQVCLNEITQPNFKVIVHLTRYGNFNNIMVLKHLRFGEDVHYSHEEKTEIAHLSSLIKY